VTAVLSSLLERRMTTRLPGRPGLKILLVDDSEAFLEAATPFLEALAGVGKVELARSADEAIVFAAHYKPDLVLIDCDMPDATGIEALRKIKARSPGLSVVVMTQRLRPYRARMALDAGADGCVSKDDFHAGLPVMLDRLFRHTDPAHG